MLQRQNQRFLRGPWKMKGDAELSLFTFSICITFQKLHKQATQQSIQVTTEVRGTNAPVAKSQGHSQRQLGISCSDRGPITLDISGKFDFIFNMARVANLSLDSLEKIGFGGSGARSCSSRIESITP